MTFMLRCVSRDVRHLLQEVHPSDHYVHESRLNGSGYRNTLHTMSLDSS